MLRIPDFTFVGVGSMVESALKLQTSSPMNNNQSRINLLKEVKSAVNTASFAPTADRFEEAKAKVEELLHEVKMMEHRWRTNGFNSLSGDVTPKASKKRKQKSGKATPATKVADRQERQFHGKADSPVTPRHTKRTASVEEARKSAQEVSDKSGATARAKRKAEAIAKAATKEAVRTSCQERADMASQPSVSDARLADLEAKIEALLALQAMNHDVTRSAEVLFSDLPFDPTSTL